MKVTRLGPPRPIINSGLGGNAGHGVPGGGSALQVLTSDGSNGRYWGENVRRITSNGSNILLSPDVRFDSGSGIIFAIASNTLTISTSGGGGSLTVADEGSPLATSATTLDFVGAGVTASGAGATKTITIPGGGGGSTIQYPALKPATPLDDFAGASLDGAWSAHSDFGTFVTGNCITQAIDGSHLAMGFSSQKGALYRSTTNVDQTWMVGGLRPMSVPFGETYMFGIAVLNTSGTGVGIVSYNDGKIYLANITTWTYASILQTFSPDMGHQAAALANEPVWMKLARVGNAWTPSVSRSGRAWDYSTSSSSVTITAAHVVVGLFWPAASAVTMQLICEWVDLQ